MKISDLIYGRAQTFELLATPNRSTDKLEPEKEVQFSLVDDLLLLSWGPGKSTNVRGKDARQHRRLVDLVETQPARTCMLLGSKLENHDALKLIIEVRIFVEKIDLPDMEIGIDDRLIDDIQRTWGLRQLPSIEEAGKRLAEAVLLPPSVGTDSHRAIIMGSPGPTEKQQGFRILGKRHSVDIKKDGQNKWRAHRVTRTDSRRQMDSARPLMLAAGNIRFVDQTVASEVRAQISGLDRLAQSTKSYLRLWEQYQKIEEDGIRARAKRMPSLSYDHCERLPDGRWAFRLSAGHECNEALLRDMDGEGIQFEAGTEAPSDSANDSSTTGGQSRKARTRRSFTGRYGGSDRNQLFIDPEASSDETPPPKTGFVYVCLRGDRTRMERRRNALEKIATGQAPLPQLGQLLEGHQVPVRRTKAYKPLSPAAKAKFASGAPNSRQEEAIRIALNSPDIAIIQGPPGTGKTRTIAAIVERLNEISNQEGLGSQQVLLTSFQHDAVENVASVSGTLGLPAMKIGRRRGREEQNLNFENWKKGVIKGLESRLSDQDCRPIRRLLGETCQNHAAYAQAPRSDEEAAGLLSRLLKKNQPHLSGSLMDRVTAEIDRLQREEFKEPEEEDRLLESTHALADDADSFANGGPRTAWKLLRDLDGRPELDAEDRALLEEAKAWDSAAVPPFLEQLSALKVRLLDRLSPAVSGGRNPTANLRVAKLMAEIREALEEKLECSIDDGPSLAMEGFLDDLSNDPRGIQEMIERYTVVLAATCQQSVGLRMAGLMNEDILFENVIVDEAARSNPLDLLIPMSLASRRVILVGDHRQLPHLLEPDVERNLEASVQEETAEAIRKSLFEHLFDQVKRLQDHDGIKRWVTLDTQYRMHPKLASFVSDTFYKPYDEQFHTVEDEVTQFEHTLTSPYQGHVAVWKDIPLAKGQEERDGLSWRRFPEAEWISMEVRRIMDEAPNLSVGVITYYKAQERAILKQMLRSDLTSKSEDQGIVISEAWRRTSNSKGEEIERLRVGTVDAFQGKEFDVVFLSLTRSNACKPEDLKSARRKFGHLLLENRLCVSVSRQRRLLIVVGDRGMFESQDASRLAPGLHAVMKLCEGPDGTVI